MHQGACLCGSVAFELSGDLDGVTACHCTQCRKQSGHYWASMNVPAENLKLTSDKTLKWFMASPTAKRGFCSVCGSFLFWRHVDEDRISISMGAFDASTGLHLTRHIFVADKGDYYDITDTLPQRAQ